MCNIWKIPSKASEEIRPEIMEKLPSGLRINITGGEPTIRPDIGEFFDILYEKSNLLELSTNGYDTDKIISLAEKYPKILIRISIEGLPKLNDKLRGMEDGFDRALRTILELKKTKCRNIGFSIVICDRNSEDLVALHELCSYLGVELGNSVMHNSWYFNKFDNVNIDVDKAVANEKKFIASLLRSPRRDLKGRLKDYGRAYFNRSILKRLSGDTSNYRPLCGAGEDFFFIDPWGNISPCNGSDEEWIYGNLKNESFESIMNSSRAKAIMSKKIKNCKKNCCFVVTERHDMLRKPWKPLYWIGKNKIKLALNIPTNFD